MDIIQVISQVGFPIAVATYTLVVLNITMKENTTIMMKLCEHLDKPTEITMK